MSVQLQHWSVYFGKSLILQDISLEFKGQGIFAIIGPSGCGKTTLLKSINRTAELERDFHYRGKILLDEQEIYAQKDAAAIRRRVGMVFQTPVALPMSVRENVLFGPRYYGVKNKQQLRDICERSLKHAGLWKK